MPDRAARLDKPTTQRIELMDMAAIIRTEFQILKPNVGKILGVKEDAKNWLSRVIDLGATNCFEPIVA